MLQGDRYCNTDKEAHRDIILLMGVASSMFSPWSGSLEFKSYLSLAALSVEGAEPRCAHLNAFLWVILQHTEV